MYNILLLVCYKGGALWEHTIQQYTTDDSSALSFIWDRYSLFELVSIKQSARVLSSLR